MPGRGSAWNRPKAGGGTYGRTVRELRFVGSADSVSGTATHDGKSKDAGDGQHQLVFELVDGTKRFRLALDTQVSADLLEALGAVAAAQIDRAPDEPPGSSGKEHPVSELRPRDIQMRVRAGEEPRRWPTRRA